MVRHVIIWTLKDEYRDQESVRQGIKAGLEGLRGKIPGLAEISVYTEGLSSSTGDLMLDSLFDDEAALRAYSRNPLHVAVAEEKVRPYTKIRSCYDFECAR